MKVIIIGNGVAGVTAARHIRELEQSCEIDIFTREPYHYYYRPRLPDVVAGEVERAAITVNPPEWYESRRINVHLSTPVASMDPLKREIFLEDRVRVSYDRLLLASGCDPFVPPVEGVGKDGVFTLRTVDDALAIRDWAKGTDRAVVVGGGLLGLETARGLRAAGLDVCVLEHADRLLPRQLDGAGARVLESDIARLGIRVIRGAMTVKVDGGTRATGVVLEDGTKVSGGLVLFSTGVRSVTGFLSGGGLTIERGVVVDRHMRTSAAGVYAAGDVAEFEGVVQGIIPVAVAQADAAAKAIAGAPGDGYRAVVPQNTLKIAGIDVFSVGTVSCSDGSCDEFVEEDASVGRYRKVVVRGGRIVGAIVIGSRRGVRELGTLIAEGVPVGRWCAAIAREDFDFHRALEDYA